MGEGEEDQSLFTQKCSPVQTSLFASVRYLKFIAWYGRELRRTSENTANVPNPDVTNNSRKSKQMTMINPALNFSDKPAFSSTADWMLPCQADKKKAAQWLNRPKAAALVSY